MLQIGELLKTTTDIIDTISSNQSFTGKMGTGRVNMFKALTQSPKPSITKELISVESDNKYLTSGSNIEIAFSFTNYLSMVSTTSIFLSDNSDFIEYFNKLIS